MRLSWAAVLLAMLVALPLAGHPQTPAPNSVFPGTSQTGADQRDVRFTVSCSTTRTAAATGVLALELYIPHYEQLAAAFDFDSLEGPGAHAGKRTHLDSRSASTTAAGDFEVSGWAATDPDSPFGLGLNAAVRGEPARLAAVARILRPLAQGAGQLVWRQANPRAGGPAIVATLALADADAARLRQTVAPCMALVK